MSDKREHPCAKALIALVSSTINSIRDIIRDTNQDIASGSIILFHRYRGYPVAFLTLRFTHSDPDSAKWIVLLCNPDSAFCSINVQMVSIN